MPEIAVGDWTVEADPVATRLAHNAIATGGPEVCGCQGCRNFIAGRELAYPPEALRVFDLLGMRRDRETEVGGPIDLGEGRYLYSGFLHFVGRIVSGPGVFVDVPVKDPTAGSLSRLEYRYLTAAFGIGLAARRDLADRQFGDAPLVQLEFVTEIPWLLAEPPEVGAP